MIDPTHYGPDYNHYYSRVVVLFRVARWREIAERTVSVIRLLPCAGMTHRPPSGSILGFVFNFLICLFSNRTVKVSLSHKHKEESI